MTEEQRKRLTGYIEERWYENFLNLNRTFTTPGDMDALRRKLVEKGEFEAFENHSYVMYEKTKKIKFSNMTHNPACFTAWIIDPTRFCELVVGYLESKEDNKK
jgi:hypothetical protein